MNASSASPATTAINPLSVRFKDKDLERRYVAYSLDRNIETDRLLTLSGAGIHLMYGFLDYYTLGEIAGYAISLRIISALITVLLGALSFTKAFRPHMMALGVGGIVSVAVSMGLMIHAMGTVSPPYYVGFLHVAVVFSALGRLHFHVCSGLLIFIYACFFVATRQFPEGVDLFAGHYFLIGTFISCALSNYHLEKNRRVEYIQVRDKERYYKQVQEMADDAQDSLRRKNALLNVLGHVVKTPLHQIIGYAQVIEQAKDMPEGANDVSGFAAEIHRAGTALSHQSQRILDYTRADAGLLSSQPQSTNAQRLVKEAMYRHDAMVRDKRIDLSLDLCETPVRVDTRHVIRSLDELIDNAIRYSPPGSKLSISSQVRGQAVVLSILDNGPGIAESEIERVGDALNKTENFRNMGGDKLGIGVSLARIMARIGGGAMTFASMPDVGSLAQLILPLAPPREETESPSSANAA